jgi:hypothetical protein
MMQIRVTSDFRVRRRCCLVSRPLAIASGNNIGIRTHRAQIGLQMNVLKNVHMSCFCIHKLPHIILRNGQQVLQVHRYKYLGTIITAGESAYEAINCRLGGSSAMSNKHIWNNRYPGFKYKVKIFK